jgi:hypothetical protein
VSAELPASVVVIFTGVLFGVEVRSSAAKDSKSTRMVSEHNLRLLGCAKMLFGTVWIEFRF